MSPWVDRARQARKRIAEAKLGDYVRADDYIVGAPSNMPLCPCGMRQAGCRAGRPKAEERIVR